MKRVLATLLLIALLVVCGALASCGGGEAHVHTFKDTWSKDSSGHWYDATCECTDAPKNVLSHVDANNDGACDVCTYTDHTHTYAESWTADCTNHWKAASCGHVVVGTEIAPHADATEDGVCDTCGYVIENLHNHYYSTEWSSDGENHWHAALCEHGVEVADKAAHTLNDAGYCTVCDAKVKEIDKTDILAVLKAAIANNHKVISGAVHYENYIPDIDYTLSHDVFYTLGNGSAYVKRYEYDMCKQLWYEYISEDEVFGVTTEDGGMTFISASADADSLKGYSYNPSTMLGSYDSTATLADTLYAIYDVSLKDTVTNKVVSYDEKTGVYTISYTYLEVREITGHDSMTDAGNDDSSAELKTDIITNLYEVEATFTVDENFVIDNAQFVVGAYNQDIDGDYVYDEETGTYAMSAGALADTYSYIVAQVSGERTYYTAYPKASLVPSDFDLAFPDGTVGTDTIEVSVGTNTTLQLVNLKPFSADTAFINPDDFDLKLVNKNNPEADTFYIYYDSFSGKIGFTPSAEGEYGLTITYGDLVKEYTLKVIPAAPNSVKLYPFGWIQGYGEEVYTADMYNPGSVTKIELDVGETIDFLVRVNPSAAEQLYTIKVDSENASITEVTLTNVVAFYEILDECTAYQFKSDVEGKYVITLTSTVNENVTSTVEVYVGDVEQEVKTSESFEIATPSNWAKSEEYVFTAEADGTYVITAEGLDSTTWLQVYNAADDTWTQIQGSLPYSVDLAAGETVTLRLYGWSSDAAVVGKMVTVTVAPGTASGGEGGKPTTLEGSGTDADPYILVENGDYVCNAKYDYVFYKYTATQAGTLTISVAGNDFYWGIGQSPMSLNAGNSNPTQSVDLAAGASVYVGISTNSGDTIDIDFTVTFVAGSSEGEDGGNTETTPDGSESNPFALEIGENTVVYQGYAYGWAYFTYTATEAGNLTITVTSDDYDLGYGPAPTLMTGFQTSPMVRPLAAGETIYIGVSTSTGANSDTPITFTASFEAGAGSEEDDEPVVTPT